ncbi:MAG: hypothetical protein WB014_02440 [Methanosarcina sp.]
MRPQPLGSCPRWQSCNVNICPLSPDYPEGYTHPEDSEKRCSLAKSYRIAAAAKFPGVLRFEGLTAKEFAGLKVWGNRPQEEREKIVSILKKNGFGTVYQKENEKLDVMDGGVINDDY